MIQISRAYSVFSLIFKLVRNPSAYEIYQCLVVRQKVVPFFIESVIYPPRYFGGVNRPIEECKYCRQREIFSLGLGEIDPVLWFRGEVQKLLTLVLLSMP